MTESKTGSQGTAAATRRTGRIRKAAIVTLVALAAGVGAVAWADGRPGGCGGPGMMGGGHGMMWDGTRMSDRMLEGLDATDAQRAQIRQITQAAAADMKTQFEAGRALRAQGLAIFGAPAVDPAAVESLRQQMVAHYDQMSQKTTQTMVAIANVLTPEQRAKFAERVKLRSEQRRDRMQRQQGASAPRS
ncbi:MAG TPA: Spy/CpxP family protein refolding chaperone [Burkholderiaceae bacterium]|nr:Spy/CpxP family protein refolding chaperone [Burkholderiaceae bacterium]HRP27208.1 Spy/CpxP family protein refolding chaperone [Burkholderiaceae bacterium]